MNQYAEDYQDLKDFFSGERAVKAEGERYTPRLEGQKDPKAYQRYVDFGILFNALSRTRQGLKGAIMRKPIDIQFPESKKDILDDIMRNGASFNDLTRDICDAVLGYGRIGVLVDLDEQEQPYCAEYDAMSILKAHKKGNDQTILLKEMIEQLDPDDPDKTKWIEQHRKLELVNGVHVVTLYQKEAKSDGEFLPIPSTPDAPNPRVPKYKGKSLNYIPFTFFGAANNNPEPSRPPLLDLLCLMKGHWKLTVAYQYSLHMCSLPTPIMAGFSFQDGESIPLGPGVTHHTPEPNGKAYFMQTGGAGLQSVENGLDRLEKQMATIGARLLESQKVGIEAAETVRLRSSGDNATLADVAGNIEDGLTDVLKNIVFWMGISHQECIVSVNKDFISTRLSAQDTAALLQAVQAGKISEETFIYNLIQGEILRPGKTIEEEQEDIDEDRAKAALNGGGLSGAFMA